MDTKATSIISALAGVGITALYFSIVTPTETIVKPGPVSAESILAKATPECLEIVRSACKPDDAACLSNPPCALVTVDDGSKCTKGPKVESKDEAGNVAMVDGKGTCEKITGWSCNGAFMPQVAQDCLQAAVDAKPKAEGEEAAVP